MLSTARAQTHAPIPAPSRSRYYYLRCLLNKVRIYWFSINSRRNVKEQRMCVYTVYYTQSCRTFMAYTPKICVCSVEKWYRIRSVVRSVGLVACGKFCFWEVHLLQEKCKETDYEIWFNVCMYMVCERRAVGLVVVALEVCELSRMPFAISHPHN